MKEKFEAGLKKRKQVLGEDYVNESFKNATSFSQPFQEFLTERALKLILTLTVRNAL